MDKSYKTAIELLNGVRRQTRPNTKQVFGELRQVPNANGEPQMKGTPSILGMKEWLQRIGHSPDDVNRLNIVHVAGTKGKGSTCAYVESFLRAHSQRTGFPKKIGLYTSPHLVCPEERIRINFTPLAQDKFAKYLWDVHDKLAETSPIGSEGSPRYLQLLALTSFHAFINEGVDAAIYETHHGGEFDATNVISKPIVTVVTSLGMDHVNQLGPTIENIAWHKAGIFKSGVPAVTCSQDQAAANVLAKRAEEKSAHLSVAPLQPATVELEAVGHEERRRRVWPEVQRRNYSLALAAAETFLRSARQTEPAGLTKEDIYHGVERFFWPGRFQILAEQDGFDSSLTEVAAGSTPLSELGTYKWFLDSAHNEMSIAEAGRWFAGRDGRRLSTARPEILIFTQLSDQREGKDVLRTLAKELEQGSDVRHVIFTTYEIGAGVQTVVKEPTDPSVVESFPDIWKDISPASQVTYRSTIAEALQAAREIGSKVGGMDVLVTGSQHLVGGALLLLKPQLFGRNTPGQSLSA